MVRLIIEFCLSGSRRREYVIGMGEVRVSVKLSSVADLALVAAGKADLKDVRIVEADALVDTGAVRSCVPQPILDRLGIRPYETMLFEYANGQKEAVGIAEGIRFEIMHRRSSDDALAVGDEVLIGQTLLEKMDLVVDCANQRVLPNPAHPDVAVNKLK
jgi:clan AA aspartic protease